MFGLNGVLFFNAESAFKRKIVLRASSGLDPRGRRAFLDFWSGYFSRDCVEETGGQQFMAPLFPLF